MNIEKTLPFGTISTVSVLLLTAVLIVLIGGDLKRAIAVILMGIPFAILVVCFDKVRMKYFLADVAHPRPHSSEMLIGFACAFFVAPILSVLISWVLELVN